MFLLVTYFIHVSVYMSIKISQFISHSLEDNFSMDEGGVVVQAVMLVMVQAVTQVMGSDGERQMKLRLLACHSPPAVWPRGWRPLAYCRFSSLLQTKCWHLILASGSVF